MVKVAETIEKLKGWNVDDVDALNMAINALKRLEPRKPIRKVTATEKTVFSCECGELLRVECKHFTFRGLKQPYCPNCGHRIDWRNDGRRT